MASNPMPTAISAKSSSDMGGLGLIFKSRYIAQAISRNAELEVRFAGALDRFDSDSRPSAGKKGTAC